MNKKLIFLITYLFFIFTINSQITYLKTNDVFQIYPLPGNQYKAHYNDLALYYKLDFFLINKIKDINESYYSIDSNGSIFKASIQQNKLFVAIPFDKSNPSQSIILTTIFNNSDTVSMKIDLFCDYINKDKVSVKVTKPILDRDNNVYVNILFIGLNNSLTSITTSPPLSSVRLTGEQFEVQVTPFYKFSAKETNFDILFSDFSIPITVPPYYPPNIIPTLLDYFIYPSINNFIYNDFTQTPILYFSSSIPYNVSFFLLQSQTTYYVPKKIKLKEDRYTYIAPLLYQGFSNQVFNFSLNTMLDLVPRVIEKNIIEYTYLTIPFWTYSREFDDFFTISFQNNLFTLKENTFNFRYSSSFQTKWPFGFVSGSTKNFVYSITIPLDENTRNLAISEYPHGKETIGIIEGSGLGN
ncbi:hypothetical protein DICPUDRAFT_146956 [Dictyostelium purpureum]|uniref:Uncharacterized protein n=1 Tax=Dictyostelium purpureum TaxID=5786 RepID=F0Z7A4_DICPU|nr:uncharacterized protein DICPUDRAFT_146956 [Dictyostelium purpureum]EGC40142.1 hypothetical protein DICPUDRAFT_146956 [Dictyostelium purpureum]|eukprot:XP_003283332.1 hypothetical protein DICPUDRAFT_146956 [Dictyostelium purpureum]